MSNARILVSGNLALASYATVDEAVRTVGKPRTDLTVCEGADTARMLAPERQLWAPDVFAARTAKPACALSIVRAIICGALLAALVGVIASSFVSMRVSGERAAVEAVRYTEVAVASGDSLWSLASEHPVEGFDTSRTVELIRHRNGLTSGTLRAGMSIEVPVAI